MTKLTHFSLFSGIGGIDLAGDWAGFETVGQVEMAEYPYQVLCKHWPDVPKWRDVREVTRESVQEKGIGKITVLSGGFPCQPFSVAGKRKGTDDDRHLWPEMFRVIKELRPSWVVGENVSGIVSMELDSVISDLKSEQYEVRVFMIPACGVGALHQRYRIFIIAHDERDSMKHNYDGVVPTIDASGVSDDWMVWTGEYFSEGVWKSEPPIGRVATGIPKRVDRLKCLGNAVVPQQIYPLLKTIATIEQMGDNNTTG